MRRFQIIYFLFSAWLTGGMFCHVSEGAELITPKGMAMDYQQRELKAMPQIKATLQTLRQQAADNKWTFQVGYTAAMNFPLEQITGLKVPENLPQLIEQQNTRAMELMKTMPELGAPACSASASSFDWRKAKGATGVRDQGPCGSCWAFGTHGAFEGSYRRITGTTINSSEQETLDCNPWGYSCNGGWWAYQYLIDKGAAKETAYPYKAKKGPCKSTVPLPYKAAVWGYTGMTLLSRVLAR